MAVGETRTVQVRLEEPLPLRAGDHVVVLSYSPVMLIGGGRVLLSRCRRSRELSAGERALFAALESGNIAGGVGAWLALQTLPVTAIDVAEALILVSARSMPHCAGWWRRAPFASLPWVMRTSWRTPWCSTPRWMHWRRPCQPCTRRLPRRQALRPAPLPMLRGLPLMKALPRP